MAHSENLTVIAPAMFSRMVNALERRRTATLGSFVQSDDSVFVATRKDASGDWSFTMVTRLGIHNK